MINPFDLKLDTCRRLAGHHFLYILFTFQTPMTNHKDIYIRTFLTPSPPVEQYSTILKENPGRLVYRQFKLLIHTPQAFSVIHNVLVHNTFNIFQYTKTFNSTVLKGKLVYHIGVSTASRQTWYCRIHIAVDC